MQYQAQAQHPETPASKHRNRNGTSARGKFRESNSKRNIPAWLPPVPRRPGLTIKSINLRTLKKKKNHITLLDISLRGPERAGLSKLASNTALFILGKILFTLLQFWVRIARCNSEIRPLILPLCLLHWLYSFRLWSHHSCLVQAPLYWGWGIKMGFNWKAKAEQGMMKTHHLPRAAITMAKFRM